MDSRYACFYLTGQLEWILRKFHLAEVVLVGEGRKPGVFMNPRVFLESNVLKDLNGVRSVRSGPSVRSGLYLLSFHVGLLV